MDFRLWQTCSVCVHVLVGSFRCSSRVWFLHSITQLDCEQCKYIEYVAYKLSTLTHSLTLAACSVPLGVVKRENQVKNLHTAIVKILAGRSQV